MYRYSTELISIPMCHSVCMYIYNKKLFLYYKKYKTLKKIIQ